MTSNELYKKLVRIKELHLRYYIDWKGVIQTSWRGGWHDYDKVSQYDKRLIIQ